MKKIIILFFYLITLNGFTNTKNQEECKKKVLSILPQIPGWCSQKKASSMMDLIFETNPKICVEIGVFAGASILPTAYALKCLNKGIVYAIDPWDTYECIKYYEKNDINRSWWEQIDMNYFYTYFLNLLKTHQIKNYCIVLKETSEQAANKIKTIDILHIDGNHCDESAFIDVTKYVPKIKVDGYIWFDGWSTSPKAFEYIKNTCIVVKVIDQGKCILLKKIHPE
jgi:hypothetical protein